MTTAPGIAAWLVIDREIWKKTNDTRRLEIRRWLALNGLTPREISADDPVMVEEQTPGNWVIAYDALILTEDGKVRLDPADPDVPWTETRFAPMVIDPPMHWLTPVH